MSDIWTPHVVVAAIVERNGKFLLVEEHTAEGLRLNNPAGHLDPGESPVEAAVSSIPCVDPAPWGSRLHG
jgi:8-oxo-dGTP pyrophosphatase MutT (NUDIX family)